MCGIIGILSNANVTERLLDSLQRLEYRGYDSAGIGVISPTGLDRRRASGKLTNLRDVLAASPLDGRAGIGHTRWATHGEPSLTNAHPHVSDKVMVVHNGIIENFGSLRKELQSEGHEFSSETDSETIAHLISYNLKKGAKPQEAIALTLKRLEGAFAIAVLFEGEENLMIGARKGSPLVIGVGDGEMFLGSDALAVGPFTNQVIYLDEGDWCVLHRNAYTIFSEAGQQVERPVTIVPNSGAIAEKGNYRHFMQKEIFEQPEATARTMGAYIDPLAETISLPGVDVGAFEGVQSIQMVACGTSYYACCVAEYWFEQIAGLSVKVDIASEFRYREPVLAQDCLAIFVSQSGETADTLAAMRYCKEAGLKTAAIVNVPTSTIGREVDYILPILAGPEIGVASTKAFTAMLCALIGIVLTAAKAKSVLSREEEKRLVHVLQGIPRLLSDALKLDEPLQKLSRDIAKASDVLYLGRGVHFPLALEGALKLKEISYIHAEGYAAGELKHGPIALIDEQTPIIFIAPYDMLFDKSLSNLQEVVARQGTVVLLSDKEGIKKAEGVPKHVVDVPKCDSLIAPIVYAIPVQLLAYHVAVQKGTDVDQPRNLAKSVTVE